MRVSELVLFHADPIFGPYAMQPETKFLRLRTPVTIGSRFDDWVVTWLGGWTRDRLSYIVMEVKIKRPSVTVRGTVRRPGDVGRPAVAAVVKRTSRPR